MALLSMVLQIISQYFIFAEVLSLTRKRKSYSKEISHTKPNYHSILLQNMDWNCVLNESDTYKAYSMHIHSSIHNQTFPKIRVNVKYYHRKPWLIEVMKNLIRQKNKLFKSPRKVPVIGFWNIKIIIQLWKNVKTWGEIVFNGYRNNMKKNVECYQAFF